MFLCIWYRIG